MPKVNDTVHIRFSWSAGFLGRCGGAIGHAGRLRLALAEMFGAMNPVLSLDERRAVLKEVDRQLCY